MTQIETIGDATLYRGDCRDILPTLGKVDAVVTDIPYEISAKSNGLRDIDYGDWDGLGCTDIALEALAMCADVPTLVSFCAWQQLSRIPEILPNRSERALAWIKSNPPILNGQHLFLSSIETAYYGKQAGAWFGGHCEKAVWTGAAPNGEDREHRTQKPIGLMKWVIRNVVEPGSLCLDPFMGSGTTGVACVNLNRKFIGIELEQSYFDIACRRIEQAYKQPRLFDDKPQPKPKQESML